jgi:hypothetical protein
MAGEWIRTRSELAAHPRVLRMARTLIYGGGHGLLAYACGEENLEIGVLPSSNASITTRALRHVTEQALRDVTLCALLRVWYSVNSHCRVENMDAICDGLGVDDLDTIAGFEGFGRAMQEVGWVKHDKRRKLLVFPNFLEYNEPACLRKKAKSNAERQALHRAKKQASADSKSEGVTEVTKSNARRDETRLDKKISKTRYVADGGGDKKNKKVSAFASRCGGSIEDLAQDEFVDRCYEAAIDFAWVERGNRGRLLVFSAAEQTLSDGNAFGLFVHILTDPDGHSKINNSSEDGASSRIKRFYFDEGGKRRLPADQEAAR